VHTSRLGSVDPTAIQNPASAMALRDQTALPLGTKSAGGRNCRSETAVGGT